MKVKELINIWLVNKKIQVKNTTFSMYVGKIGKHVIPSIGNSDLKTIENDQNFFIDYIQKKQLELSKKSLKDLIIIIKGIFDFAYERNYISKKINIVVPTYQSEEIRILPEFSQFRLENYCLENISRIKLGILFSLFSGIRIGELCALKCSNIDINHHCVKIKETIQRIKNVDDTSSRTVIVIGTPKSPTSIRELVIIDFLLEAFKKYAVKDSNSFLLSGTPKAIEPRLLQYHFNNILITLGLNKSTFHCLRHTFATNALMSGMDIKTLSEIMGHSSVKFTIDHYCHSDFNTKYREINNMKKASNTNGLDILKV